MRGGALYQDLITFEAHAQCFADAVNLRCMTCVIHARHFVRSTRRGGLFWKDGVPGSALPQTKYTDTASPRSSEN